MGEKIYLASPTMHGDEQKFIKEAFDTNWVAPLGANVNELEKEIASYVGTKYATALSSGTAGLHLAIKLAGVKRGDIVFCSDLTFSATVNPVSYEGGVQVFIDSEYDTWNMDPKCLEKAIKKYPKGKAVIVANLYGVPAKLNQIKEICEKNNLVLIEDAAESLGASFNGKMTGSYGKYGVVSFNGNKIITTSGGGMLLSDDKDSCDKALFWATQARERTPWYQHEEIGYNYRMSNIVAGIGRGQVPYINEHVRLKTIIYNRYGDYLKGLPLKMNPYLHYSKPNFWLSCLILSSNCNINPMNIYKVLKQNNIESRPIWKPMHLQPIFKKNDYISIDENNVSEDIFLRGLCLPSDIKMTEEEQNKVILLIKSCFL